MIHTHTHLSASGFCCFRVGIVLHGFLVDDVHVCAQIIAGDFAIVIKIVDPKRLCKGTQWMRHTGQRF